MKITILMIGWLGLTATSARAQSFFLDQFMITGGGGVSAGGGYTVTGAMGQPVTGTLTGGGFSLASGLWSAVTVVQTPGAPRLSIERGTKVIVVSWPAPEAGWRLQTSASIATAPVVWTEVAPPYSTGQSGFYIVAPATSGLQFYRLHRP